jgi:hypothetical protein
MEELYLIYIHVIGSDRKGVSLYEFIFSNTKEDIDGDGWDSIPAAGNPSPPFEELVKRVGTLVSPDKQFNVIQDNDSFSVWDAVDGVIGLAWENMDSYEVYPESRLHFHFGEEIKNVESKLYEHDLILDYKKELSNGHKEEDK